MGRNDKTFYLKMFTQFNQIKDTRLSFILYNREITVHVHCILCSYYVQVVWFYVKQNHSCYLLFILVRIKHLWNMAISNHREFGRCMVFYGFDKLINTPKLSLEEFVLPNKSSELSKNQVLLKIALATVCGSDLHTLRGRRKEPVPW